MSQNLYSWNVNGIRSACRKGFESVFQELNPVVMCLQEVKALEEELPISIEGYHLYWNAAKRRGYSGTAVFSKIKPQHVEFGLRNLEDEEGRVVTLEYAQFFLVTVYTPNSKRELLRLDYRIDEWDRAFLQHIQELEKSKPVVFCGDLNVAHKEIDLANPKTNRKNPGFTDEERGSFTDILNSGYVDSFRQFHPEPHQYTWWSQRKGVREKNIGWRLDYFCVSTRLSQGLVDARIHPDVMGSDHCPVSITVNDALFEE